MIEDTPPTSTAIAKDGEWQVPPEKRPAGWESMGLREQGSSAVAVIEPPVEIQTCVVANSTAELPTLQAPLLAWARKRLEDSRAAWTELDEALTQAKKQRWHTVAIRNAATRELATITYYEKIVAALSAGYMLFPPVPNADVIAIRTSNPSTNKFEDRDRWGSPQGTVFTVEGNPPALGEGQYYNPVPGWTLLRTYKTEKDTERKEWQSMDLQEPHFPLAMAKPEIIEATNAAMELKVFDEIRMFPFERRGKGDPCLLGSIVEKKRKHLTPRRQFFLISWRIDAKDI